jgi:hypothetical protein
MLARPQFLALTALGGLALALMLVNGTLAIGNRARQAEISTLQAGVQQTAQLQVLQTEIAKALAELAIKGNDKQVLDMLAANGITVTLNQPAGTVAAAGKR